ncbi:related to lethal(2) denticleless protein [Rhynchosporium agropyri]|uniref:Related to lethal(2) denticleless protein n=1 Tax=Rhynchosporium agropyri TaxID=914238 RepID=A0A1E1KYB2_9HELO|nr:related to lethal(2) denticleless protein [Rhynchosporium agropyri]
MSSTEPKGQLEPAIFQENTSIEAIHGSSPPQSPKRGKKERRAPSVTPRKFTRFFTPRSTHGSLPNTRSRRALNDIAAPNTSNRYTQSSPLQPFRDINGQESSPLGFTRESKRRKVFHTMEMSNGKQLGFVGAHDEDSNMAGVLSSPCERAVQALHYIEEDEEATSETEDEEGQILEPVKRIVRIQNRGLAGQLLHRSTGTSPRHYLYPVNDWQDHTAKFYSNPEDVHTSMSILHDGARRTIPFCARGLSAPGSSLVAIGDEEGYIRILESAKGGKPPFTKTCFTVRLHSNAIIDMSFTDDDSRIATASGDQTARVFDMQKQATLAILGNHTASLKQVRWQPGAGNKDVLATSSRDGSIQLWDLRCNIADGPVNCIVAPRDNDPIYDEPRRGDGILFNRPVTTIYDGHKPQAQVPAAIGDPDQIIAPFERQARSGDVSITAIEFLPAGREHLLISASEADASVKLWDIRQTSLRNKPRGPLASTAQPQSHNRWRHFGVNTLNLSGDGSRFYTLCKDNTVYAYSTEHLMLGHVPELSTINPVRASTKLATQEGLGPLYGFRHPKLHATTFYVKSDIRKARNGKCEMLAVGSSDGFTILFPTDERYLPRQSQAHQLDVTAGNDLPSRIFENRPTLRRSGSGSFNSRVDDSLLISTTGTALVRGHDREVGSISWTSSGDLVTVGDDYLIRCWREDGDDAKDLRVGGEKDGRRWGSGWADVEESYDDDDE